MWVGAKDGSFQFTKLSQRHDVWDRVEHVLGGKKKKKTNIKATNAKGFLVESKRSSPQGALFCCDILIVNQQPPTPGPRTAIGPQPVRNRAEQQEVGVRRASEASSVFTAAPPRSYYRLNHTRPPTPSVEKLSSRKPVPGAKKVGDRCKWMNEWMNESLEERFWALSHLFFLLWAQHQPQAFWRGR